MRALRKRVSGSRNRYIDEDFDLDLTYITPRVIAMGYPATGVERTYRNDSSQVAAFFASKHSHHYRIYNLSMKHYDSSIFQDRVEEYGFPDHHPPPLNLLLHLCFQIKAWLELDAQNVAAVHCMAGKGRTGMVISCFLLLSGYYGNVLSLTTEGEIREKVEDVVQDFWHIRGQGVRYPSQRRYISYLIKTLQHLKSPSVYEPLSPPTTLFLKQIIFHGIPSFSIHSSAAFDRGITPCLQVFAATWREPQKKSSEELVYNSAWEHPTSESHATDVNGCIAFPIQRPVAGDIVVRCFHMDTGAFMGQAATQVLHCSFHTDFVLGAGQTNGVYRLTKDMIDDAHDNQRFPPTFFLDFIFQAPSSRASEGLSENPKVFKMGWLIKQGGWFQTWKRRWFVLTSSSLAYYSNDQNPTPLGIVKVEDKRLEFCHPSDSDIATAPSREYFYFKVVPSVSSERTYYFGAISEADRNDWIHMIYKAIASNRC